MRGLCKKKQGVLFIWPQVSQKVHQMIKVILFLNNRKIIKAIMSVDLTKKQAYLYKQIIEAGLDPEAFQSFLIIKNPKLADNINEWLMNDLIEVVEEFKKSNLNEPNSNSSEQINQPLDTLQKQEPKLINPQTNLGEQKKCSQKQIQKGDGGYINVIKCQQKVINQSFFNRKITLKILKFDKKEGGIFEKSYVSYLILVEPFNIQIERRYSDFQWLREKLEFLYPGTPIPPISKKGQYRRYDEKHLQKRLIILEMFLNKIVNMAELKSEVMVENFLLIKEKATFQKFKLKFKGLQSNMDLNRTSNLKGEVKIGIDKHVNSFIFQSQKHFSEIQPQIKKIYKDFKGCATALESCSQMLRGISINCERLAEKDMQFRLQNKLDLKPNNVYTNFQLITTQYSNNVLEQSKLLRNELYGLIKYESLYMINLIESFQTVAEKKTSYNQLTLNLLKKKEKLYEEGNMTKWGLSTKLTQKPKREESFLLMLPKQTLQCQKLKQDYALFNYKIYEESQRYFKQSNQYLARYVRNYIEIQSKLNSKAMMLWVDMLTQVMSMEEDKNLLTGSLG